jgi:hypothetical protein
MGFLFGISCKVFFTYCKACFTFDKTLIRINMNTLLLPHRYKKVGWALLAITIVLYILTMVNNDLTNWTAPLFAICTDELLGELEWFVWKRTEIIQTLMGSLVILGGLLVSFSRECRR